MRALLAAIQCEKGDLAGNLATHARLLDEAAQAGCDIAVFPEMSLTGSVDPRTHPDDAVTLEHEAIGALAHATRSGVAALFGFAERDDSKFFITQAYARDGNFAGSYRKRHLGEGEDGFTPGDRGAVFELRAERFGVAICAEGGFDDAFSEPAAAGARVVFFCAAPGLTGRRIDDASWRDGFGWWEECGLGDARRQARNNRVWVALITQAGSTRDEDFPGLAGLVSPTGEVAARLPDWQPATLIVDIPEEESTHGWNAG